MGPAWVFCCSENKPLDIKVQEICLGLVKTNIPQTHLLIQLLVELLLLQQELAGYLAHSACVHLFREMMLVAIQVYLYQE